MSRISPRVAAWTYAALVAVVAAWFLADIPVQLSDSLGNLIGVSHQTLRGLFVHNLQQHNQNQRKKKVYLRRLLVQLVPL